MNRSFPSLLISIFLFASVNSFTQGAGSYSESIPYSPRMLKVKTEKGKTKQASDSKTASVPSSKTTMTIPVSVLTNDGATVSGLQTLDFKAFVDETEAEIVSVETKDDPLTVVLVLDMSPSTATQVAAIKTLATRMVENLRPVDKVMVVGFNMHMVVKLEPTADRKLILKAINKLEQDDGSAIYNLVENLFMGKLAVMSGTVAVVLITDGVDTRSLSTYERSLVAAEKGLAAVFPIYFDTSAANQKAVEDMSRRGVYVQGFSPEQFEVGRFYLTDLLLLSGGRTVVTTDVLAGKTESFDRIPSELTARYNVTFKLPIRRSAGERRGLKIRVGRPGLKVLAKGSYIE